jgi:nitrate reductase gamma subunit
MSGAFLVVFAWCAIAVFLTATVCRILSIARLPVHLRWELAPIPRERSEAGGSYLEEYEWWKKARRTSIIAPLLYMAREIFFLRGVWKHNRSLWPFSFAMHTGIYLLFGALLFHFILVIRSYVHKMDAIQVCLDFASAMALCGYVLGAAGTLGLLLKRILDPDLRWSNSRSTFVNLLFLAAVFVSGIYAWFASPEAAYEVGELIGRSIAFLGNFRIVFPLALHVILLLLFCAYLPFTNMIHFAAKYFTYHEVVWNDKPLNGRMERQVADLLSKPVGWDARHARADGRRSWAEAVREEGVDEKAQS